MTNTEITSASHSSKANGTAHSPNTPNSPNSPNSPRESNPTQVAQLISPPKLLTPSHLRNYPLVKTGADAIHWMPGGDIVLNTSKNTVHFIRSFQPFKYVIETSDRLSNSMLDTLDNWVPTLQTIESRDITDPVTVPVIAAVDSLQHKLQDVNATVNRTIVEPMNKNVIEPTVTKLADAKQGFQHMIYKEEITVEEIAASQANPNANLENENGENGEIDENGENSEDSGNITSEHYAKPKETNAQDAHTNEFARTFKLMGNLISREGKSDVKEKDKDKEKDIDAGRANGKEKTK